MIPFEWIKQARERIRPFIKDTPLTRDEKLDLYLKWENHQVTGSFKVRGAFNKIYTVQDWELERGLVAASAGNHGQGVALAAKTKGAKAVVFASEHALKIKLQAMQELGAEIHLVPGGYGEAEHAGISYARATGATWVSPYNDGMVIAGQGTIALEVLDKLAEHGQSITWIVPAGGGGLLAGIGCALQSQKHKHKLVAVQSEASPFLYELFHHGSQSGVKELPSLADGLAGPVEHGSVTIPMVKNCVTDFVLVSEQEIRQAIQYAWSTYHEQLEGSAAAALAAVLTGRIPDRPALVVLTGGNIPPEDFAQIINEEHS